MEFQSTSIACSFSSKLHPEHEAIKARCDPWIVALIDCAAPARSAAASSQFWLDSNIPDLCSRAYAQCPPERVLLLAKLLTWLFVSDTDDDDPSARGCEHGHDDELIRRRHQLILDCYAGKPPFHTDHPNLEDEPIAVIKGLAALHEIWKTIAKDLSPKMLARYLDAVKAHLNANSVQASYRATGRLPGVAEYIRVVRRPASIVLACFILLEYGLGIELDDDTLGNQLFQRLQDAATDHIGLSNDLVSWQTELAVYGDQFNLPCIIFHEKKQALHDYTFADAMRQATMMMEEVDRDCVPLLIEVEADQSLMAKPGLPTYLKGLRLWMAGNVHWSLHTTTRYSSTKIITHHIDQKAKAAEAAGVADLNKNTPVEP